jgi:hypothetical protein
MRKPIPQLNLSPDERWVLQKWASCPEFPCGCHGNEQFWRSPRARTIGPYREKTSKETAAEWCVSFASSRLDSMCHDRRGRKPPAVTLSKQELLMLKRLTERPKYQRPLTRRARMILARAEGKTRYRSRPRDRHVRPRGDEVARSISCATAERTR